MMAGPGAILALPIPTCSYVMRSISMPLRPVATLGVVFLILVAFAWAGSDETRLERTCLSWVQNVSACSRF